ncbi:MAG: hypothetical protein ACOC4M_18305, partial [Promethearchaeia archaeon]
IRHILKTKTFKVFLILFILYWTGFAVFMVSIYSDLTKIPGENIFRDILWIIYWRWNLDYLIIGGFLLVIILETYLLYKLKSRISDEILSIYVSPILTMSVAFVYMLAIDLGVTYFADTGFDGNWESTEIIWLGMTAQNLYHNFFFWYVPIVIIAGITNQIYIHTNSVFKTLRGFSVLMAIYSLNLGFLDPIVCQILWDDWRIFGEWSMGGANAIFAEGWIAHYVLFCIGWFVFDYFLRSWHREILYDHQLDLKA